MIEKNKIQISVSLGNIGDTIMCLPATRYIAQNPIYGLEKVQLYTNHTQLVSHLDVADYCELLTVRTDVQIPVPEIHLKPEIPRGNRYHAPWHRVDEAFWWLGLTPEDTTWEQKSYPRYINQHMYSRQFNQKYVVLGGTFSCRRRKFSDRVMYRTCKYLIKAGYLPVIVGASNKFFYINGRYGTYNVNYEGCVNLVDKLQYGELLSIMSHAEAVVSPDSGILHMAALTDVPIIGYYTIIHSDYVGPIRNGVLGANCIMINADVPCAPCYSRTNMLWMCSEDYQDDPLKGYYKEGDAECVKALKVRHIIQALQDFGIK